MRIVRRDGGVFAFAGLWESWRPPGGDDDEVLYTCTIITTDANDTLRPIHHRMPVILPPEAYDSWLDREIDDPEVLLPLLQPAPTTSWRRIPFPRSSTTPATNAPDASSCCPNQAD